MVKTSLTRRLANFAYNFSYNSVSDFVIKQVKRCLLDYLGVTLAGYETPLGKTIVNYVKNIGGCREATLIGDGCQVPCSNAAFANATLGHILELDDGHRYARGHPGVTSIPAVLSIAEKEDSHGKDVVTAIILGYEIFARIAKAINPSHLLRGFHTTGTCGTFGAAIAAGKVLDLNEKELTNALGIAGTQASGLMEVFWGESRIKPLQAGKAAQSGVLAAILAKEGITAPDTILEGEKGFIRATSDSYNLEQIVKGLNQDFEIMNT
ncbi:MAG: MmgE/PrpD family protein [Candidatus Bathyarchaeota archaeon]|nr:MAG: MmgE/PrpD family protein [Candidatus Bathyarchaeota archaeon]